MPMVCIKNSFLLRDNQIHFTFPCETWLAPDFSPPKNNMIFHIGHARKRNVGHYPYGLAIIINPRLISKSDFNFLVIDDQFVIIFDIFNCYRFFCVYIPPEKEQRDASIKEKTVQKICRFLCNDKPCFLMGD